MKRLGIWDEYTDVRQAKDLLVHLGFVVQGVREDGGNWWRTYRMRHENGKLDVIFDYEDAVWIVRMYLNGRRGEHVSSTAFVLERNLDQFKQELSEMLVEFDELQEQRIPTAYVSNATVGAYLAAAVWTATDDDGNPLDREFNEGDFSPEARIQALTDLQVFMGVYQELLDEHPAWNRGIHGDDDVAHDFWLTRNGHGRGFWDKPEMYGDFMDALTAEARKFGERHVYVGDGQLHFG